MSCILHRKWVSAATAWQGGVSGGGRLRHHPQGVPELFLGYISPILGAGQDGEPPTSPLGKFQLRLALLATVSFRVLSSTSSIYTLIFRPTLCPSLTLVKCALRYSDSLLSSEAVRTSQQCYDISKLAGGVWVGSRIPIPTRFTPQVIRLQRESATYSPMP